MITNLGRLALHIISNELRWPDTTAYFYSNLADELHGIELLKLQWDCDHRKVTGFWDIEKECMRRWTIDGPVEPGYITVPVEFVGWERAHQLLRSR